MNLENPGHPYPHNLLYKVIHPEGNYEKYRYQYDAYLEADPPVEPAAMDRFQVGNLLAIDRWGERDGVEVSTHEERTYEPFYTRMITETGPRGFDPGADPSHFRRIYTYDFQEGSYEASGLSDLAIEWGIDDTAAESLFDLGDVNGDGNAGYPLDGVLVREEAPKVTEGIAAEGGPQAGVRLIQHNDAGQVTWEQDEAGRVTVYSYYPPEDPDGDGTLVEESHRVTTGGGYLQQKTVDPEMLALTWSYTYNPVGDLLSETDPEGNRTVYKVNARHQVWGEVKGAVDLSGQPVSPDAAWSALYREYDEEDEVVKLHLRNDDPATNAHPSLDTPGYVTFFYTYDGLGRLRKAEGECVDPGGPTPSSRSIGIMTSTGT